MKKTKRVEKRTKKEEREEAFLSVDDSAFLSKNEIPLPDYEITGMIDNAPVDAWTYSDPEIVLVIKEILESMTKQELICFDLYYFQGVLQDDIALKLGITSGTVATLLYRARGRVREAFGCFDWFMRECERLYWATGGGYI